MNFRYENYRYYTPYQVFNPYQITSRNNLLLDISKDTPKYNFSQIGYQIMNPQLISYHLEPIYSSVSSFSKKGKMSTIEIGKPVLDSYSYNNNSFNYEKITEKNGYNNYRSIEMKSPYENKSTIPSTNDISKTRSKSELKSRNSEKMKTTVSPFVHIIKTSANKFNSSNKRQIIIKKRSKLEWLKLFKNFVNIYVFFSSAKKYSCVNSKLRNKLINERIKNVVNDIATLKDWIISTQETFFDKFKNYEQFNGDLITQGDKNLVTKKNILNNIKLFINNLTSDLDIIPENVQNILYKYIKNNSYFPKKYLSKFEINRIDFNFYGETKNINKIHSAMILSYLIINGVTIQQILLHLKDVFTEYSIFYGIEKAAINLGSVLHHLVKKIFRKKLKVKNDIIALFNYYRNYHLFDAKIEKLKDKINQEIIIEENDNEDEYNKNLLPLNDIKRFFNENNKTLEEFMDRIYDWSFELSKNLRNKFLSSEDLSINSKNKRKYSIKSKIINAD